MEKRDGVAGRMNEIWWNWKFGLENLIRRLFVCMFQQTEMTHLNQESQMRKMFIQSLDSKKAVDLEKS